MLDLEAVRHGRGCCRPGHDFGDERKRDMRKKKMILLVVLLLVFSCGEALCDGGKDVKEKPSLDVPYEPTTYGIAEAMLSMADVTSKDVVYDLGCGDGRIVIMAAKERGARGVGVDLDPERIRESKRNARAAGVTDRVTFFVKNLFDTDISDATVMMLYLWPEVNLKVRPKLLKELRPGTRVVSHSHTMGDWEADAVQTVEGHKIHFFVIPANVSGTWRWVDPEGRPVTLTVKQKFQKIDCSLMTGDRKDSVTECRLRGDAVRIAAYGTVNDKKTEIFFDGRVSGDTMAGKSTRGKGHPATVWKATREPLTARSIAE